MTARANERTTAPIDDRVEVNVSAPSASLLCPLDGTGFGAVATRCRGMVELADLPELLATVDPLGRGRAEEAHLSCDMSNWTRATPLDQPATPSSVNGEFVCGGLRAMDLARWWCSRSATGDVLLDHDT